jgi:hypothetical protein
MGAWDYGPFDSDNAMEWIDNEIGRPVLEKIRAQLKRFLLEGPDDDVEKDATRAAVGLLIYFCHPIETSVDASYPINLYYQAKDDDTFDLAAKTIRVLLDQHAWIESWSDPQRQRQSLTQLLERLEQLKALPPL